MGSSRTNSLFVPHQLLPPQHERTSFFVQRGKFVLYTYFIFGLFYGGTNKETSWDQVCWCPSSTYIFHVEMGKRPVYFIQDVNQCSEGRLWCFLTQIPLEVWARIYCEIPFLIICLVSSVTFTYQMFFTLHDLFRWSHAYAISEYKHMHNRKTLVWHHFLLLQSVGNGQTSPSPPPLRNWWGTQWNLEVSKRIPCTFTWQRRQLFACWLLICGNCC